MKKDPFFPLAVYPGSFNPWHKGHEDILKKALLTFDRVIIAIGNNPDKIFDPNTLRIPEEIQNNRKVSVQTFSGLLKDFVEEVGAKAVVRGLRDGRDLDAEKTQQYWCEDLGMKVPVVYYICDRSLVHISSSAIRSLEKFK